MKSEPTQEEQPLTAEQFSEILYPYDEEERYEVTDEKRNAFIKGSKYTQQLSTLAGESEAQPYISDLEGALKNAKELILLSHHACWINAVVERVETHEQSWARFTEQFKHQIASTEVAQQSKEASVDKDLVGKDAIKMYQRVENESIETMISVASDNKSSSPVVSHPSSPNNNQQ